MKSWRIHIILLLIGVFVILNLVSCRGSGIESPRPTTELEWKTYSIVDGLAGSGVSAILQDSRGNMWFGTCYGGVSRFDGLNFQNFTEKDGLPGNYTEKILEDKWGNHFHKLKGLPKKKLMFKQALRAYPKNLDGNVIARSPSGRRSNLCLLSMRLLRANALAMTAWQIFFG